MKAPHLYAMVRKLVSIYLMMTILSACEYMNTQKSNKSMGIKAASTIDLNELQIRIQKTFDSSSSNPFFVWKGDTVDARPLLKNVYASPMPLWLDKNGINDAGVSMLQQLADLRFDGLATERYNINELNSLITSIKSNVNQDVVFDFEIKMTDAFLKAARDLILGGKVNLNKEIKNANDSLFDPIKVLKLAVKNGDMQKAFEQMRPQHPWYFSFRKEYERLSGLLHDPVMTQPITLKDSLTGLDSSKEIILLRKRLYRSVLAPTDTLSARWDEKALEGLKKFQHAHQLRTTGRLDTATLKRLNEPIEVKLKMLALNMERMRWLKHDFKQPYIWVDIPKMEMDYVEHDSIGFNMRVVVGRPSRATPALDAAIQNVVLSPPWNVPPTIMREEVVPGIARRGGSYLARRGLRAYDRRGRPVSASAINASNYRNFSIGQAPGYHSSLGEVKFNMPNPWAIYMHDTPHREDFVKFYRAFSSGCVRVHKPKEFATFLLRDTVNYSYQKIDSICKLRKTIFVPVNRNIDVHFVYLTNALDSAGNVMYLRDIYGWD